MLLLTSALAGDLASRELLQPEALPSSPSGGTCPSREGTKRHGLHSCPATGRAQSAMRHGVRRTSGQLDRAAGGCGLTSPVHPLVCIAQHNCLIAEIFITPNRNPERYCSTEDPADTWSGKAGGIGTRSSVVSEPDLATEVAQGMSRGHLGQICVGDHGEALTNCPAQLQPRGLGSQAGDSRPNTAGHSGGRARSPRASAGRGRMRKTPPTHHAGGEALDSPFSCS